MRASLLLLLLLCLFGTWAQEETQGASQGADDSLQMSGHTNSGDRRCRDELRDMLVEQRIQLQNTKAELQALRDKVAGLEKENAGSRTKPD